MATLKVYSIQTDITAGKLGKIKLNNEIASSGAVGNFDGIGSHKNSDVLKIFGDSILDEPLLDTTVADHVSSTLSDNKKIRRAEVDVRTRELIIDGFTYDSETFSLSTRAQINWISFARLIRLDELTLPQTISTKGDGEYSGFSGKPAVKDFFTASRVAVMGHLESGRDLKILIKDATTQAELDAIVDTR